MRSEISLNTAKKIQYKKITENQLYPLPSFFPHNFGLMNSGGTSPKTKRVVVHLAKKWAVVLQSRSTKTISHKKWELRILLPSTSILEALQSSNWVRPLSAKMEASPSKQTLSSFRFSASFRAWTAASNSAQKGLLDQKRFTQAPTVVPLEFRMTHPVVVIPFLNATSKLNLRVSSSGDCQVVGKFRLVICCFLFGWRLSLTIQCFVIFKLTALAMLLNLVLFPHAIFCYESSRRLQVH